ncbi:MAG: type II toxin-antitoxin system VapB family antitoxin [Actinomycetota bacterium]|jgi:predicted transcriptional regulator|nr:type II toxin-antitoxin system VapB family antitoxin [Actinomycetota bacterium]
MKTTLNLDDELMRRAKQVASSRGSTLTAVVEGALRAALSEPAVRPEGFTLRLPTVAGGRAAVDPADRGALYDLMDNGQRTHSS